MKPFLKTLQTYFTECFFTGSVILFSIQTGWTQVIKQGPFYPIVDSNLSAKGADGSGGGVQCIQKLQTIQNIVVHAVEQLQSLRNAGISSAEFKEIISKIVFNTGKNLTLNGESVDALNFPNENPPRVVVDENRCDTILADLNDGMGFLVHETLGLMRKESRTDYSISRNVLIELKKVVIANPKPNWRFICSLKRLHYSGIAGWEFLSTIDTFGNSNPSTGYLTSRSDSDLDEYHLHLSISTGNYQHEPRLQYSFFRDPQQKYELRQTLTGWTPVDFEKSKPGPGYTPRGKVTIKLLGPEAFPREGRGTSSRLEMDCYRSL